MFIFLSEFKDCFLIPLCSLIRYWNHQNKYNLPHHLILSYKPVYANFQVQSQLSQCCSHQLKSIHSISLGPACIKSTRCCFKAAQGCLWGWRIVRASIKLSLRKAVMRLTRRNRSREEELCRLVCSCQLHLSGSTISGYSVEMVMAEGSAVLRRNRPGTKAKVRFTDQ